jgi:hypothetical protein
MANALPSHENDNDLLLTVPDAEMPEATPAAQGWWPWIKRAVSLGLLLGLMAWVGWKPLLEGLAKIPLWLLPVSVAIYLVSQAISAWRWRQLGVATGLHLPYRVYLVDYLVGMFWSLFLPGAIGGDVGRLWLLARQTGRPKREALATLLAERGLGMGMLVLLAALGALLPCAAHVPAGLRYMLLSLLAGLGVVGLLARTLPPSSPLSQKILHCLPKQLGDIWRLGHGYLCNTPLMAKTLFLSLLVHLCMLVLHLGLGHALGLLVPAPYWLVVYGLVGLASVLPIAINGLGVREGAYVMCLGFVGVPVHQALTFAVAWLTVSTLTSVLAGGALFFLPKNSNTAMGPAAWLKWRPQVVSLRK